MHKAVEQILIEAASTDVEIQRNAGGKLNDLFEQSARNLFRYDPYVLPVELQDTKLTIDQQREVIERLETIILNTEHDPSAFLWAIGKAHPYAALETMLNLVHADLKLIPHTMYQVVIAFDNYTTFSRGGDVNKRVARRIQERYPTVFFEKILNGDIIHNNMKEIVELIVERLETIDEK